MFSFHIHLIHMLFLPIYSGHIIICCCRCFFVPAADAARRRNMSYDPMGVVSDAMLDSLSVQLREAEVRRAEAERAHQVCHVSTAQSISIQFELSISISYLCVRAVCVCVYYFSCAMRLRVSCVFFRCDMCWS